MKHATFRPRFGHSVLLLALASSLVQAADALPTIQQQWAHCQYQETGKAKESCLATLSAQADQASAKEAFRTDLLIWSAIVKSTWAGAKGGLGAFLYLEVLDASFSFDGVIGAFALTQNLFVIAIGLGIGAMYVRSMTIMLVERGTLAEYRYLEHGAFYAIVALAVIMFIQPLVHIPEVVTGLGGATLIGISLLSSIRWNRKNGGAESQH